MTLVGLLDIHILFKLLYLKDARQFYLRVSQLVPQMLVHFGKLFLITKLNLYLLLLLHLGQLKKRTLMENFFLSMIFLNLKVFFLQEKELIQIQLNGLKIY